MAGYMLDKSFLRFERSLRLVGETYSVRYPEHMSIYSHSLFFENHRSDYVSRFATHTRQLLQFVYIRGDNPVEITEKFFRHSYQMFRFVVGVGDTFDIFIYDFWGCRC